MTSTPEAPAESDATAEVDEPAPEQDPQQGDATPESVPAPVLPPIDEVAARVPALAALAEVTPVGTVGAPAYSTVNEDGVLTLRFENRLAGYPGWFWTVSLAQVEGAEPTVLEVELLPDRGALLAPDWVPWAERLADYQAAQAALAEAGVVVDEDDDESDADDVLDEDDDLDDVDDLDAADFDNDGSPILHSGDVDGVDIDELDESAAEGELDDESDEGDDADESDDDDEDESDEFDDEDESPRS